LLTLDKLKVVYNWGGGGGYIAGDSDGQSYANVINNYFISGPSTSVTAFTRGNANFHGCTFTTPFRTIYLSRSNTDHMCK
jgi:hypothetical protein